MAKLGSKSNFASNNAGNRGVNTSIMPEGRKDSPPMQGSDPRMFGKAMPGSAAVRRVIVGDDDRTEIQTTEAHPWRCICNIEITLDSGKQFLGSGWLAAPRLVVTAGHCLYHSELLGGWASAVTVLPGRQGAAAPNGTAISTRFSCPERWSLNADPDFDFGCIHLEEPIGESLGFLPTATPSAGTLRDAYVNLAGYPGDLGAGRHLYHDSNVITDVGPRRISYLNDARSGQSGSPVWIQETSADTPQVVGIHCGATTTGTPGHLSQENYAVRISDDIEGLLAAWSAL